MRLCDCQETVSEAKAQRFIAYYRWRFKATDKKYSFHLVTEYKVCIRLMLRIALFFVSLSNSRLGGWEFLRYEKWKSVWSTRSPVSPHGVHLSTRDFWFASTTIKKPKLTGLFFFFLFSFKFAENRDGKKYWKLVKSLQVLRTKSAVLLWWLIDKPVWLIDLPRCCVFHSCLSMTYF